jgi:hypothetical protein
MKSENIPTKTLRELAKEKGLPQGGKATALRERIAGSIPSSEVAAYAQDYLHTKRAFSYIFYRVTKGDVSAIFDKLTNDHPVDQELKPAPLDETPKVNRLSRDNDVVYIHIAFRGDTKHAKDEWELIEYTPPVQAVVVLHTKDNVLEIRSRKEKIETIEKWISGYLKCGVERIKFANMDLQKIKEILKAVKNSNTLRMKSGLLGTVRLAMASNSSDSDKDETVKRIREILESSGYDDTSPTFIMKNGVRVRGNSEDASFYIPKHITESEAKIIMRALILVTSGATGSIDLSLLSTSLLPLKV